MDPAAKKHTTDFEKEKQLIREFFENYYVESENGTKVFKYREQIVKLAEREEVVLNLNLSDLASYEPGLEQAVHENAARYHNLFIEVAQSMIEEYLGDRQPPVRDALDAFIFQRVYMDRTAREANAGNTAATEDVRKKYPPQLLRRFEVSMKSQDTDKTLSVRQINAHYVGKLVTVGGIVIRATEVRPMASVITYACDTCGAEAYQPVSGPSFTPAVNCPSKDCIESRANGRLHMQIRGSKFVKFQEIKIQETSDQVPIGSIPRTVTINVYGESTRKCQPGDLVRVTGVLIPMLKSGFRQAGGGLVTDTYIEAFYVENTLNSEEGLLNLEEELTDEEIERISQGNFYEQLAYSIAPEIYGHTDVKKSLLLALIGGVDKNAEGMKIRGCLNVLLMGDPGVAKSQLLSYVDRLAPRSQYTTGRGSSGVGLTAAVVKDSLTGEMTLEGGALVLADKGVCCIDEFDKMVDSDRTAIHEVMEQQTISIAKAGIMTTLNARVAIIAAANPAFGRYNPKKSIEQNIDLPAALLSRFDMLWLIQDKVDRDSDRRLAEHITYVHQHGQQPDKDGLDVLPMALVRKYIAICKRKNPVVDQKLRERLVELYVEMRKSARDNDSSTFTSPRMLLSVIRLREVVTEEDIEEAIRLTLAAKDSLRADQARQSTRQAPVDAAFSVLREIYQNQSDNEPINMQTAVQRCARKGISEQVLNECIESHVATGVLVLDRQKRIVFAMN